MSNILISVIVPVHNTKPVYLEKCLDSLAKQQLEECEFLIVDSSTNASTVSVINQYLSSDSRFRLIYSDSGVSKQRNCGIENSKGKYIAFIDSDDRISSDYFKEMLNVLLDTKSDIVFPKLIKEKYCNEEVVGFEELLYKPLNKKIDQNSFFECTPENGLVNPIKLYDKKIIGKNRFSERLTYGEDMIFNYELSKQGFYAAMCEKASYFFSADIHINSAMKRLKKSSLNIIPIIFNIYRHSKKTTPKKNLDGILYQFNHCFEIFFRACALRHKTLFLLWLLKFRYFYISKNKLSFKEKIFIIFPYFYLFFKKIIGTNKE